MNAIDKAQAAWGEAMPEEIALLAQEVAGSSLSRTAKRIGVSSAMISRGLSNGYSGKVETLLEAVRVHLMGERIDCPALGVIPKAECGEWRAMRDRPAGSNPPRAMMAVACRGCRHFGGGNSDA